jgi:hypothetical protein
LRRWNWRGGGRGKGRWGDMQFYILQYAILGRWVDGGGGRFDQMTVGNILKSHTPNMSIPNKYERYGFVAASTVIIQKCKTTVRRLRS